MNSIYNTKWDEIISSDNRDSIDVINERFKGDLIANNIAQYLCKKFLSLGQACKVNNIEYDKNTVTYLPALRMPPRGW